jgi:hypothetical protein
MSKHILLDRFDLEDVFSKRREIITQWNGIISQKIRILNNVAARKSKGVLAEISSIFTLVFPTIFSLRGCKKGETK